MPTSTLKDACIFCTWISKMVVITMRLFKMGCLSKTCCFLYKISGILESSRIPQDAFTLLLLPITRSLFIRVLLMIPTALNLTQLSTLLLPVLLLVQMVGNARILFLLFPEEEHRLPIT